MVRATCQHCKRVHEFDDADVPPSGKIIKCSGCGGQVVVMPAFGGGLLGAAGAPAKPPAPKPAKPPAPKPAKPPAPKPAKPPAPKPAKPPAPKPARPPVPKRQATPPAKDERAAEEDGIFDLGEPIEIDLPTADGDSDVDIDLPAPVSPADYDIDLPAPVGPSSSDVDLPAPVGPADSDIDLPAPVGPADSDIGLGPVGPAGAEIDLPAPVGPFPRGATQRNRDDNLPTPARSRRPAPNLPAPKGFFDDLPADAGRSQPAAPDLPAPKGFFDDLPADAGRDQPAAPDVPAPKGFFDDLPADAGPSRSAAPDVPAPKGFFDDLPADAGPNRSAAPDDDSLEELDLADAEPLEISSLDPGTFQQPAEGEARGPNRRAPSVGFGASPDDAPDFGDPLELDAPLELGSLGDHADEPLPADALDLDDAPPLATGDKPRTPRPFGVDADLDLEDPSPDTASPAAPLELDEPRDTERPSRDAFDDLDLPDAGGGDVVTFSKPAAGRTRRASAGAPAGRSARAQAAGDLELDEIGPPGAAAAPGVGAPRVAKKLAPPKQQAKSKRPRIVLIAALAVLIAGGGGGYMLYARWQRSQQRAASVRRGLADARRELSSAAAGHWERAAKTAQGVLRIAPHNLAGIGIAAQAEFAAALDEGTGVKARGARGAALMQKAESRPTHAPAIAAAEALQALLNRSPKTAVETLSRLAARSHDATTELYLGWAEAAAHHHAKAAAAFSAALAKSPALVPALYGLGMSKLALGRRQDAEKAFLAVLKHDKDHIGAQIGVAELKQEPESDRENDYLAILHRKDIDRADPRAVSRAWALAGDEALRSGRVDVAGDRYKKALDHDPHDIDALVGQGRAALADGKFDTARDLLDRALSRDPAQVSAAIARAEVALHDGKPKDAQGLIARVLHHSPPVQDNRELVRAHLVQARVLDASGDDGGAERAYRQAVELAGDRDVNPTIALSQFLSKHGRGSEAVALLKPVEAAAKDDASLAVTLGVAYLGAGDPKSAANWFRSALAKGPKNVEARFQLGLALLSEGHSAGALAALAKAYQQDPSREDIGSRLAAAYEKLGRDTDAARTYKSLLAKNPSIHVLEQAGRYYARRGDADTVVDLGKRILAQQADDPAGLFLRGEGYYAQKNYQAAAADYRKAVTADPRPQYLNALGRAYEQLGRLEDAVRAYGRAQQKKPDYLPPRLGRARVRMARHEYRLAAQELEAALKLAPQNAAAHAGLGAAYLAMGNDKQAVPELRRALTLDRNQPKAYDDLGRAYYDLNKPGQAAAALSRATHLAHGDEPWVTEAYRMLGYADRTRGDRSGAIAAWRAYLDRSPTDKGEVRDVRRLLLRLGGL